MAELTSYCFENLHAAKLYNAHRADTDYQWTTFLTYQLGIYSDVRMPTSVPVCLN